jgi:hypothetical protein
LFKEVGFIDSEDMEVKGKSTPEKSESLAVSKTLEKLEG